MKKSPFPQSETTPVCLSIAGLDPSGGAGLVADIKTFSAFGCFAATAVTSVTFQNTQGVFGAVHQTSDSLRRQLVPILDDFEISAVKTGMLPTAEIIEETARFIIEGQLPNLVVDPVVRSTSGFDLIDDIALRTLIENLFPLADLITPNLPEAARIAGMSIENESDLEKAATIMRGYGAKNILIKGGHMSILNFGLGNLGSAAVEKKVARDFLFLDGKRHTFEAEFIETSATHGTGCTLASAVAANLAHQRTLIEAVGISKDFVHDAIKNAPMLGKGNSPIGISRVY